MIGDLFGALFIISLLLWGIRTLSKGTFVRTGVRKRPQRQNRTFGLFPNRGNQSSARPQILYHGTKLERAIEIYESGLWMVGKSRPRAIWMGDNIGKARGYSGKNGGIIVIRVHPGLGLTERGSGVYIFMIPNARPYEEYYRVEGLTPVAVLNSEGNTIR